MKLKSILPLLMAILTLTLTFTACSSDDNGKTESKNYLTLKVNGNASLTEDSKDTIQVNVALAYTLKNDATLTFALDGNDGDVLALKETSVTIKAGEKTALLKIYSNNKESLNTEKNVTVKLASSTDTNVEAFGDPCTVTIKPDSKIPELTAEQKALLEGYKKMGIDVSRMLGLVKCKVEITFNDDDKAYWNGSNQTRTIEGTSIITLSEAATADKPVLKMVDNPMGLNDFLKEMLYKTTVDDTQGPWSDQPYPKAVLSAIKFDKQKETFSTSLDNLVLDTANKSIAFTSTRTNDYDEEIVTIPFSYEFSAWTRLKKQADEGKTAVVENEELSVKDLIEGGGSLNPESYLFYSSIAEDTYGNDPSDWVKPAASYDFNQNTFSFTFPFDSYGFSGYSQIRVTYTMNAAQ